MTVNQNAAATCRNNSTVHNPPENAVSGIRTMPITISFKLESVLVNKACLWETRKHSHQADRMTASAPASTMVFVHHTRERETGCANRLEKVPEDISRPNESSAIMTTTAGQRRKANTITITEGLETDGLLGAKHSERVINSAMQKLGSNSLISFFSNALMILTA